MTEMRSYDSEDKIIKDLLETNIRQRGTVGGSELKLGRRIKELSRIYGIRNGDNQYSRDCDNRRPYVNIAEELGISERTLYEILAIERKLTPEMKELLDKEKLFSKTTAAKIIAKLSSIEQEQLISALPVTEKLTQKQVQEYVNQLKTKQDSVDLLKT